MFAFKLTCPRLSETWGETLKIGRTSTPSFENGDFEEEEEQDDEVDPGYGSAPQGPAGQGELERA